MRVFDRKPSDSTFDNNCMTGETTVRDQLSVSSSRIQSNRIENLCQPDSFAIFGRILFRGKQIYPAEKSK